MSVEEKTEVKSRDKIEGVFNALGKSLKDAGEEMGGVFPHEIISAVHTFAYAASISTMRHMLEMMESYGEEFSDEKKEAIIKNVVATLRLIDKSPFPAKELAESLAAKDFTRTKELFARYTES